MSKFINKFTILITGFYIIYLGVLPLIGTGLVKAVLENLSHNSPYEIQTVNPQIRLSVLPTLTFKASEIYLKSKTGKDYLKSEGVNVRIRLLPLLSGKVHINNFNLKNLEISKDFNEPAELDRDFFSKLQDTKVFSDGVNIGGFRFLIYTKGNNTPIIYHGEGLNYRHGNRYIKFAAKSMLQADDKTSGVNINLFLPKNNDVKKTIFDINVTNLDIAPFQIYFKHYLPKQLQSLEGIVNVNANNDGLVTRISNFKAVMQNPSESLIFPEELNIESKFKIKRRYITFENAEIKSDRINLSLKGRIYDYLGDTMPTLDINIGVNPSEISDIISMMPAFRVEEIDVYKLKKYKFYGKIMANLSIKGRLPEPDVNGDVYITDGVLIKPIPNAPKGAVIKLHFTGKYAYFDVNVPAGFSERVQVKGNQEIYNVKYADMKIKSTKNVDLQTAQFVVVPLHEILNFIIGPVPIMDIHGSGNIDIIVKGNRKNPHIWGVLNLRTTSAKFNDIPDLKLENADNLLNFNDVNVVYRADKAFLNGKEITFNGTCDISGKFDFNASGKGQPADKLYQAVLTSPMLADIAKMLPKIDKAEGGADFKLKIFGNVKTIADLKFNKNVFVKGNIDLKNNKYRVQNIDVENTNGTILVEPSVANVDLKAKIANSPMSIKAKVKDNIGNVNLNIPKLNPNFLVKDEKVKGKQYLPLVSVLAEYKGDVQNIDYKKVTMSAKVVDSAPESLIKYQSGDIAANNGKITIKNLKGFINNPANNFEVNLKSDNAFALKPELNGAVKFVTPNLSTANELLSLGILPENVRKITKDFEFTGGGVNVNCKIVRNKIDSDTNLGGISFIYKPLELPVKVINGTISLRNNSVKLNKINLLADKMPILADGDIKDIFGKQNFNIYLNSKPRQDFIDKYINRNRIYPLKVKGDIVYLAQFKGVKDNFDLKAAVNMSKDSNVYHYGATVGDVENAIVLNLDSKVLNGNNFKIKEFSYDKLIDSQSGRQTRLNMLKAGGGVEILKDDLGFKDLHIKTNNPTDARIFNIIFRKPNIKQGQFTSDLKFNGKLSNPNLIGDFHIFETNIPFMDTTMKNIEFLFRDKTVEIKSKGDIMGNDVSIKGTMKNKLTLPYEISEAEIYTDNLDLNTIVNKLKIAEAEVSSPFESFSGLGLNSILFNKVKLKADNITLRNIHATNFEAVASLNKQSELDISNFSFNIAQGRLGGQYKYNLKNYDTVLNLKADEISANDITLALFDLNNQIYGDLTGTLNLACSGNDFQRCMESLNGSAIFNVKDGRMPKLGSLEYLLKAGNLVKGGITGISINSVIDLITPLKTGEFSDIFGSIAIKNGVADNIEISSKGKDLNLFIGGHYNFATSVADMEVLGLLSRKISTLFGPIGNMSVNTLFNVIPGVDLTKDTQLRDRINKIPGIELSSKAYRKFVAEIKGNINGEDYVTSFRWIN